MAIVTLVVVMMMLVPGCGEPSEEPDPIEISVGRVFAVDTGSGWEYYVYISIRQVNMAKPPVWEDVRVHVVTTHTSGLYPDIETLIDMEPLRRQPTSDIPDYGVSYYQKPGLETERVSETGSIGIQGMDLSFQHAQVSLEFDGRTLTYISLPPVFPVPPCYITFPEPTVTPIKSGVGNRWDLSWTVLDIEPEDSNVTFADLFYRLQGSGEDLFIPTRHLEPDPESGGPYDQENHGNEMKVWYVSTTNSTFLKAGDSIRMTYIDQEYRGATFDLKLNGTIVKTTYLPADFP